MSDQNKRGKSGPEELLVKVKQNKDTTHGSSATMESAVSSSEDDNIPMGSLENRNVIQQVVSCPEILNSIFTHMTLEERKAVRLVCKSWNEELCRVLKKTCFASTEKTQLYYMKYDTISEFKEILETGANLKLPCPFGGIEVRLDLEKSAEVEAMSQELPLPVVSLSFGHNFRSLTLGLNYDTQEVFAVSASSLIKSCSSSLTSLNTISWGTCAAAPSSPTQFPKLETLSVFFKDNTNEGGEHSDRDEGSSSEAESEDDADENPNPCDGGEDGSSDDDDDDEDLWRSSGPPKDKQPWEEQAAYFIKVILASPNLKRLNVKVEANSGTNPDAQRAVLLLLNTAKLGGIQNLTLELRDPYTCKNPFFAHLDGMEIRDLRTLDISVGGGDVPCEIEPLDSAVLTRALNRFSHSLRTLHVSLAVAEAEPLIFSHFPSLTTLKLPCVDFRALDLHHLPDLKSVTLGVGNSELAFPQLKGSGSVDTVILREPRAGLRGEKTNSVVADQLFKKFPNAKNWYVSTAFLAAFAEYARAREKCVEKLSVHYTRLDQHPFVRPGRLKLYNNEATEACLHLSQLSSLRELAVTSLGGMDLGRLPLSELPNLETLGLSMHVGESYSDLERRIEDLRKLKRVVLFYDTPRETNPVPEDVKALPNVIIVESLSRVTIGLGLLDCYVTSRVVKQFVAT